MALKCWLKKLNVVEQCREQDFPLWQCPQFFFLITGLVTIAVILAVYAISTRIFENPLVAAWIVVGVAMALLIVNFSLSRAFGKVAEANRMKSEFIRIVSHQLRSPLTNIKWSTDFLSSWGSEKNAQEKKKYFKALEENIVRMQELISNLLLASRIEAGTMAFSVEKFFLPDLVKEIISKFQPTAEASNVNIFFEANPDLPEAMADPSQIKIVVENLVDNAIRYTQPRNGQKVEGRVSIRVFKKDNYLYFEIKDSGTGIPEADQRYIFQRFFRGERGLRHQTLGSGLGLYIAKSIIEKSGGKMYFNSKINQGTTFWFTLPILRK